MSKLNIKDVDNKIIMPDSFAGVDVNNLLATGTTYTATEDCWCLKTAGHASYGTTNVTIDGVNVHYSYGDGQRTKVLIPVKAGQTVVVTASTEPGANFYARKY